jgi:hypothetical protein
MSLAGRLTNVFAAPGEVFDDVRTSRNSAANWLVPAFLLMVVSWIGVWLVFSQPAIQQQLSEITDQAIEKQVAKMPKEQADRVREQAARFGGMGQKIGAAVVPVFGGLVTPFLWALVYWLVGNKVLKGTFSYMKTVEAVGLSTMIVVLDSVIRTLMALAMGNVFAAPSLALFVKNYDPQNTTHALLSLVNVMTFWVLLVRSIGLARLSNASLAKAGLWVFGLWAAWTGLLTGIGLAIKAMMGQ